PFVGQLNSGGNLAQTWDQITNFHVGIDKLDLTKLAGSTSLTWIGPANTTSAGAYKVWYNSDGSGGSFVYADTNGDGSADLKIQLAGITTLTANDVLLHTAPTAVASVTALSTDSGTASDFITNVASQTVSGTYTGTLNSGETIQVSADGGAAWVTAGTVDTVNHTWSASGVTLSASGTSLLVRETAAEAKTTAGTGHSYTLDTKRPTATIVVADSALQAGETSLVTITFSEAVSGFDNSDLSVANGTLTGVASTDGGVTWTATLTPTANIEDTTNLNTGTAHVGTP